MAEPKQPKPDAFRRFEELAKRLVGVSKREVDQKEQERPKRERKPK